MDVDGSAIEIGARKGRIENSLDVAEIRGVAPMYAGFIPWTPGISMAMIFLICRDAR